MTTNIRLPRSHEEYIEACKLVDITYRRHGYVDYLKPENNRPDVCFVAEKDSRIIGSIGLKIPIEGHLMPIEWFYGFNSCEKFPQTRITQQYEISNLACYDSNAFRGLIIAVYKYANTRQLTLGLACMKPLLAGHLKKMGVNFNPIEDTKVHTRRIPNIYRGYFLDEPRPIAISIGTAENAEWCVSSEQALSNEVKVEIDPNIFQRDFDWFLHLTPIGLP